MTALESQLQKHLQKLPPNRVAEVVDFAAFLAAREERQAAVQRLRESQAKLDALGLPPITEDEVEEAVQQSRRERRRQAEDDAAGDDDAAGYPRQRP
jgi:hypothetical protein